MTTTTTMRVMPEGAKTCMTLKHRGSLESDNVDFHTVGNNKCSLLIGAQVQLRTHCSFEELWSDIEY